MATGISKSSEFCQKKNIPSNLISITHCNIVAFLLHVLQSDFLTCCRDLEHTPQLWATHASGSNALKDFCSEL